MSVAASLLRDARVNAGLTQAELARRLGVSQAAVAKLEGTRANPTIATLKHALRGAGRKLTLTTEPLARGIDETLVIEQLRLTPDQRLAQLESMYEAGRQLTIAGESARGELA
ncbi:MAG TPA: helix-turn-helix domain-containing protein [Solirubrobacteraceae bacterium]|nr:helix-turn-helix domain-containing protein [Solirubrobacteraceae bacterium]